MLNDLSSALLPVVIVLLGLCITWTGLARITKMSDLTPRRVRWSTVALTMSGLALVVLPPLAGDYLPGCLVALMGSTLSMLLSTRRRGIVVHLPSRFRDSKQVDVR